MQIIVKTRKNGSRFYETINAAEFDSRLEIPDGRDMKQNAWLTITVNYTLNFVDSRNPLPGLTISNNKVFYALDSNTPPERFRIKDWDIAARSEFVKKFQKGESFWNYKFLLTPRDYDAFDFTSWGGSGWICRPNVICLFRLKSGGSPNHLPINVVRTEDTDFRSSKFNLRSGRQ